MKTSKTTAIVVLLLMLANMTTHAQEISMENARQTAVAFLKNHAAKLPMKQRAGLTAKPFAESDLRLVHTEKDLLHEQPALYVFQHKGTTGGFVIASADERVASVLGYSEEGVFLTDNLPCGLQTLLERYAWQIAEARERNLPRYKAQAPNGTRQNIPPLLKSKWGQFAPYNGKCPIDPNTSERCVTGCVATAMAQIMYYHQWPERGTGSYSYRWNDTTLTANFGETEYRFDLMKDEYEDGEEDDNVATLMYHCGVAAHMQYSSAESGGMIISRDLTNFFGYSPLIKYVDFSKSETEIDSMLYHCLANGWPIYYTAQSTYTQPVSAHAMVCDGYRTDGYIHINFGWNGSSNGYFRYNLIGYFNEPQTAMLNVIPNKLIKNVEADGLHFAIVGNQATLMDGSGSTGNVQIPSSVMLGEEECPVMEIHELVFKNNRNITSVTVPEGVKSIGRHAFQMSSLTTVTLPNSIVQIDYGAFQACEKLTNVTLPKRLKFIGYGLFSSCTALQSVTLPDGLTGIAHESFLGCQSLHSITFPSSVTEIEKNAFAGSGLRTIVSLIEEPFDINRDVFGNHRPYIPNGDGGQNGNGEMHNIYTEATLYVPVGTLEKYREREGWKEFVNIVEGQPSTIETIENKLSDENKPLYNVGGQRVSKSHRGIVIQRGKKKITLFELLR